MLEALEQSAMLTVGVKKTNTAPLTRPALSLSYIVSCSSLHLSFSLVARGE